MLTGYVFSLCFQFCVVMSLSYDVMSLPYDVRFVFTLICFVGYSSFIDVVYLLLSITILTSANGRVG